MPKNHKKKAKSNETTEENSIQKNEGEAVEERDLIKEKVHKLEREKEQLEMEVAELRKQPLNASQQHSEVAELQKQSEEVLTRAKGIIFDKTKICKNQELQIEALQQQVSSLKEVLGITRDLLEIRNVEVQALQQQLDAMAEKIGQERRRHDLMHQKMDAMAEVNAQLKQEYGRQLDMIHDLQLTDKEKK